MSLEKISEQMHKTRSKPKSDDISATSIFISLPAKKI